MFGPACVVNLGSRPSTSTSNQRRDSQEHRARRAARLAAAYCYRTEFEWDFGGVIHIKLSRSLRIGSAAAQLQERAGVLWCSLLFNAQRPPHLANLT